MTSICLQYLVPDIFRTVALESEVWGRDSVCLQRGKNYLVEAASGTGKSSLLSFIYGYRDDYSGTILMDGEDVRQMTPMRKVAMRQHELSLLFQELRLFPSLTAYENILLKNQLTNFLTTGEIHTLFERMEIADKWDTPVRLLSWGQQQRVALIRALCQPCSFLMLDEPISHLDDANAREMAAIITERQEKYGFGVIATSVGKPLPIPYSQSLRL